MRNLLWLLLGCAGLISACGDPSNKLYGSVSEVYKLDFNQVLAIRQGDAVSIEYLKSSGAMPAKLTVEIGDIKPVAGLEISLADELAPNHPRATLQRVDTDGATVFDLQTGKVVFKDEPTVGADLTGWFRATLAGDTAAGRTLNGDFSAKVEAR